MTNPKILIQKGKKKFFDDIGKAVTLIKEKTFYISDTSRAFSTQYGTISKTDLTKTGKIKSSKDKDFIIFDAALIDRYKRIKRLPQIIPLKDIGTIIAQTGLNNKSVVVEGGAGSGALGIMLALHAKKVTSYEIEPEHMEVVKENISTLNIKNLTLKHGDMTKKISEKNVDLICLDLPNPWDAIQQAEKALKAGGFLVNYSPTIMQTADFVNSILKNDSFIHKKTVEIIEREWEVEGRKVRPKSKSSIHSGFLTFVRKVC